MTLGIEIKIFFDEIFLYWCCFTKVNQENCPNMHLLCLVERACLASYFLVLPEKLPH